MVINASLETSGVEQGFDRIKGEFDSTKGTAKSFNADLTRISQTAKGLATTLTVVGTAGAGAMVGLASRAPAVAPALAKIGVEFDKMSRLLGEELSPIFESVANNLIPSITNAITDSDSKISGFVETISTGVKDISSAISGNWSDIENAGPKSAMAIAGAAAGFALMGPKGLFIGAALGYAAEGAITSEHNKQVEGFLNPEKSREKVFNYMDTLPETTTEEVFVSLSQLNNKEFYNDLDYVDPKNIGSGIIQLFENILTLISQDRNRTDVTTLNDIIFG